MLGLNYFNAQEIKNKKEFIQGYLDVENGSPIIASGRAFEIFKKNVLNMSAKILDAAPGTGSFLRKLSSAGYKNLYAADIDDYTRDLSINELKTVDFCFDPLPWPDAYFDVITSFETIEHLENPHHFIREIRRVLKPEGIFIMSTPNIQHIFNRIFFFRKGDMPRWRKNNNHIAMFPKGLFEKSFLPYFQIVEEGYYWGYFPYRALSRLKGLPENKWFAHTVYYVFKPKNNTK